MGRCMAFLQPTYVLVFTGLCYTTFLLFEILPRIESIHTFLGPELWGYSSYERDVLATTFFFHLFMVMFLISFRLAATRSPGRIPLDSSKDLSRWRDGNFNILKETETTIQRIVSSLEGTLGEKVRLLVQNMVVVERKKKYGYHRFCSFCTLYKPDRTHHCRICSQCTLRMDHHCPWLANCVGYANYKFFILTLFYALSLCTFMLVQMGPTWSKILHAISNHHKLHLLPVSSLYVAVLLLTPMLLVFLCFHIYLTANSMTTIEYREKKNSSDPYVQRRFQVAHLKFDKGYLANLRDSLGPFHLLLIPVFNGENGTYSGSTQKKL
ncbi:hypothetical protein AAMO2058_001412000 [Amorphochlora amoebiformis]